MRMQLVLAVVVIGWAPSAAAVADTWDFEGAAPGKLPVGWTAARTGQGPSSVWEIREDPTAPAGKNVLAQVSAAGPRPVFNLCVAEAARLRDVELEVAVKALEGKIDQGGGPVWRYQDADNYYIARFNPLEHNYRVYKVIAGKRVQLATADVPEEKDAADQAAAWRRLRVSHRGNEIRCWLDGKLLLEASDDAIAQSGKVGLWTKADAVTAFDALKAEGK